MNYLMIQQLEFTFSILKIAGYQVRSFLQTARDFRCDLYSELTDAEFEALMRAYRFIYNSGALMFKDSHHIKFVSDEVASDILKKVKEHLFYAKIPEEVFPNQSQEVFLETENMM